MKNILVLLMVMTFSFTNVNAGENTYKGVVEDCKDYTISPNFLICKIHKAGKNLKQKLTYKKDGSKNSLGKWMGAKSAKDWGENK